KFIMLNVDGQVVGCIVDEVTDIVHFNEEELQPAPALASSLNVSYIKGIAKVGERMIIMLDPIQLLTADSSAIETPLVKLSDLAISS
ncbi:chemotaxis protein CheW, partial [Klebsiella pneumoniae]|nr:chemotaxis protein CheW [Klebsiella pneumoniae]